MGSEVLWAEGALTVRRFREGDLPALAALLADPEVMRWLEPPFDRARAAEFLRVETLLILGLGLVAFVMDTVGGVMFAKLINLFSKKKVNPMIGACGISAFPMSSRVIHKMAIAEDPYNFLLIHAAGTNVAGQIASVIAGGLVIKLVENLL